LYGLTEEEIGIVEEGAQSGASVISVPPWFLLLFTTETRRGHGNTIVWLMKERRHEF